MSKMERRKNAHRRDTRHFVWRNHRKKERLPDLVVYIEERNRLVLVDAATKAGPITPKRRSKLKSAFSGCNTGLVFVTAFPTRSKVTQYLGEIAWETEVWVADAPSHLIHFNGKVLGPYPPETGHGS